jgi:Fic family protein
MLAIDTIKINQTILNSLCEIDEFKGFWVGLETHTSGLALLREVAEYGADFKKILGPLKGQTITPFVISVLHAAQIKKSGLSPYRADGRTLEITKNGQIIGNLETAPSNEIKELTSKLVVWMNRALEKSGGESREIHPLIAIGMFTAIFLQISPYETDNLKLARFLIVLFMLKAGYSYAPYIPLERVMEGRADEIYESLRGLQASIDSGAPDWDGWIGCFLNILKDQKSALRDKMFAQSRDLSHLPTLSGKILKLFEHHKRLQMKQIEKLTNGRRSTIKLRLGEMVDKGYVKRYGSARATWYSLS